MDHYNSNWLFGKLANVAVSTTIYELFICLIVDLEIHARKHIPIYTLFLCIRNNLGGISAKAIATRIWGYKRRGNICMHCIHV
jgi:hypothetical protein